MAAEHYRMGGGFQRAMIDAALGETKSTTKGE